MKITVNRAVLKLFLDFWKKELLVNYDKAVRLSGLMSAIDNVPMNLLRQAADASRGPELVTFELVDPKEKLWQILQEPSTP